MECLRKSIRGKIIANKIKIIKTILNYNVKVMPTLTHLP